MITPSQSRSLPVDIAAHLGHLLTEHGNATFECGAFDNDSLEEYSVLNGKARATKEALIAFVTELVTPASEEQEGYPGIAHDLETARTENLLLTSVLNQARETLLVFLRDDAEAQTKSLGKLNLACKAHWDWQTERMKSAANR